jgi:hypothetical protein
MKINKPIGIVIFNRFRELMPRAYEKHVAMIDKQDWNNIDMHMKLWATELEKHPRIKVIAAAKKFLDNSERIYFPQSPQEIIVLINSLSPEDLGFKSVKEAYKEADLNKRYPQPDTYWSSLAVYVGMTNMRPGHNFSEFDTFKSSYLKAIDDITSGELQEKKIPVAMMIECVRDKESMERGRQLIESLKERL